MAEQMKIETKDALSDTEYWGREIEAGKKALEKFTKEAPRLVKRYLAQSMRSDVVDTESGGFPIFWSNVNILKAALYARMPTADVSRRFKDPADDVGRVAGEIMERLLNFDMSNENGDIDAALRSVIEDRLVTGMGQVWLRYDPTIEKVEQEDGAVEVETERENPAEMQGEEPTLMERVVDEHAATEYVHWSDFLFSPSRHWGEVRWVARRVWMTREMLIERFGKDVGAAVPLSGPKASESDTSGPLKNDPWRKAGVWEIWDKSEKEVVFYVKGYDKLLLKTKDPLGLSQFFPCPRPLLANITTTDLVPRADYTVLRKQYAELDTVSDRISLLEDAIRVVGVYDQGATALQTMLAGSAQNRMIAVDSWAAFAEKGGLKGAVDWLPIDMVVAALTELKKVKAELLHDLYELTGLSDIMRGATVASETATAQQLKAQYASVRLQFMQGEFARFVQELLNIKAEIVATHFQPDTLISKSLIDKTPDAQLAMPAVQLLKEKKLAYYQLRVDPDSMALVDYRAEQEAAQQYITAVSAYLQQAVPLAQTMPEALPFLLHVLSAVTSRFKFGKQVEGVLDQALQQLLAQPPGPKQPSPMEQATLAKTTAEAKDKEASATLKMSQARRQPALAIADLSKAAQPPAPFTEPYAGGLGNE